MSNEENNNQEQGLVTTNATTASVLMQASGQTFRVTGLTLSTSSTLYMMKYLTTAGCSLLEYLPHLFNDNDSVTFKSHMAEKNTMSWTAVGSSVAILTGGIVIRKIGSMLSNPMNVARMERFLYGKKRN